MVCHHVEYAWFVVKGLKRGKPQVWLLNYYCITKIGEDILQYINKEIHFHTKFVCVLVCIDTRSLQRQHCQVNNSGAVMSFDHWSPL